MLDKLKYILLLIACIAVQGVFAQNNTTGTNSTYPPINPRDTMRNPPKPLTDDQAIDTLRKKEASKRDSVIFNSKFIRVTNEALMNDSTQIFKLDTGLVNFENYNPLYQPRSPKIGLGSTGLSERNLLFEPDKHIGFDVGQHDLDVYLLRPSDIQYYRARVPYTNMYLVTGGRHEQIFKLIHTQNINPQLNMGFIFNTLGSQGYYPHQNAGDVNVALFSWYQSKGKRYNLLANVIYNSLKAPENGGLVNQNIFTTGSFDKSQEPTRLVASKDQWNNNGFYLKQFYYIGRIDSAGKGVGQNANVQPTQRVAYTFYYNVQRYQFVQTGADTYKVFPDSYYNSVASNDSLRLVNIHNDFSYSFYLRPKSGSLLKNEVKLDLGLTHDYYHYTQSVSDSVVTNLGRISRQDVLAQRTFQNITLKGKFSYRFSDKIALDGDLQQIAQGYNGGDYLYDFKLKLAASKKAGQITFDAYAQNNTPPLIYTNWISNHYIIRNQSWSNTKITSASFNYLNEPLQLDIKAEYFMINGYLYFKAQSDNGINAVPAQITAPVNLIKISVGKTFAWARWHFENYVVYQKTDYQSTLRTPDVYTYSNLYYRRLLFDVLNFTAGVTARYNTSYVAPSYAVGLGQFYNGTNVTFTSYPVASIYLKATLQRTNLFLQYDYANQGIFSPGIYTVNRYPMPDATLKFGVSWTFYN